MFRFRVMATEQKIIKSKLRGVLLYHINSVHSTPCTTERMKTTVQGIVSRITNRGRTKIKTKITKNMTKKDLSRKMKMHKKLLRTTCIETKKEKATRETAS